jgi:hypothetical protein
MGHKEEYNWMLRDFFCYMPSSAEASKVENKSRLQEAYSRCCDPV